MRVPLSQSTLVFLLSKVDFSSLKDDYKVFRRGGLDKHNKLEVEILGVRGSLQELGRS